MDIGLILNLEDLLIKYKRIETIKAKIVAIRIRVDGYKAENQHRASTDSAMAYSDSDFNTEASQIDCLIIELEQ